METKGEEIHFNYKQQNYVISPILTVAQLKMTHPRRKVITEKPSAVRK